MYHLHSASALSNRELPAEEEEEEEEKEATQSCRILLLPSFLCACLYPFLRPGMHHGLWSKKMVGKALARGEEEEQGGREGSEWLSPLLLPLPPSLPLSPSLHFVGGLFLPAWRTHIDDGHFCGLFLFLPPFLRIQYENGGDSFDALC